MKLAIAFRWSVKKDTVRIICSYFHRNVDCRYQPTSWFEWAGSNLSFHSSIASIVVKTYSRNLKNDQYFTMSEKTQLVKIIFFSYFFAWLAIKSWKAFTSFSFLIKTSSIVTPFILKSSLIIGHEFKPFFAEEFTVKTCIIFGAIASKVRSDRFL